MVTMTCGILTTMLHTHGNRRKLEKTRAETISIGATSPRRAMTVDAVEAQRNVCAFCCEDVHMDKRAKDIYGTCRKAVMCAMIVCGLGYCIILKKISTDGNEERHRIEKRDVSSLQRHEWCRSVDGNDTIEFIIDIV